MKNSNKSIEELLDTDFDKRIDRKLKNIQKNVKDTNKIMRTLFYSIIGGFLTLIVLIILRVIV